MTTTKFKAPRSVAAGLQRALKLITGHFTTSAWERPFMYKDGERVNEPCYCLDGAVNLAFVGEAQPIKKTEPKQLRQARKLLVAAIRGTGFKIPGEGESMRGSDKPFKPVDSFIIYRFNDTTQSERRVLDVLQAAATSAKVMQS